VLNIDTQVEVPAEVIAKDVISLLDQLGDDIHVLSLDCFDTLLWRKTAMPSDVFYAMQHQPIFQKLGATAYQRIAAAAHAYRAKTITHNSHQISLAEIYQQFTGLSAEERDQLAKAELQAEIDICFAFPPFIELMMAAIQRGIKIVIVSDTYLDEKNLRYLLSCHLPKNILDAISHIFTSIDYGVSKSDGLFKQVADKMEELPQHILHVGDHHIADYQAPKKLGIQACHFAQFDTKTNEFLKLQHAVSSLAILSRPAMSCIREARYNPFRALYSLQNPTPPSSEFLIGYMTFGPLLYAFAQFITEEIKSLQQGGKKIKVFFLLRDAYLLYRACEVYASKPVGSLTRIRKFLAVAASFRSQEDIDYYLSGIKPEHFNTYVICEQLLIPHEQILQIQHIVNQSANQQEKFFQILHEPAIMTFVFQRSAEVRERLKKYLVNVMKVEAGDTLVLVDTGYHGVTQDFLKRAVGNELNIEIIGRYFIASHEPDRPDCKSLITSPWCEHGLFEQSCTYKEGAVSGYDENGEPILESIKLSDQQYQKVQALQNESLRFISEAKIFFDRTNTTLSNDVLQKTAEATLIRHIFFPMIEEVQYFCHFQHDKDMGPARDKTLFNIGQSQLNQRQTAISYKPHPYEARSMHLDMSLSAFLQRAFDLNLTDQAISYVPERLQVLVLRDSQHAPLSVDAMPTQEGYFSAQIQVLSNSHVGIVFGDQYEWVQIECIKLLNQPGLDLLQHEKMTTLNHMKRHQSLFECETNNAFLMLPALNVEPQWITYQIVFRPILRRNPLSIQSKKQETNQFQTSWITSMESFAPLIEPVLKMLKPAVIAEIGAAEGGNTRFLYEFLKATQGRLLTMDPSPRGSFVEWVKSTNGVVTHFADYSLNCILRLGAVDVWFVDGDHNWYTVFNELSLIDQLARQHDKPAIIFMHDVSWPCARRDMYYDPNTIPSNFVQPNSNQLGITFDNAATPTGALKGPYWALQEGGPRNGVLTAVEDFLQATPTKYYWFHLPVILGLGVLVDESHPLAKEMVEYFKPFHDNPVMALVERDRISQYLANVTLIEKLKPVCM